MSRVATSCRRRMVPALLALLAGGTTLGTCEMRLRDAAVLGTKQYFLQDFLPGLIDPQGLVEDVVDGGDAADDTNG